MVWSEASANRFGDCLAESERRRTFCAPDYVPTMSVIEFVQYMGQVGTPHYEHASAKSAIEAMLDKLATAWERKSMLLKKFPGDFCIIIELNNFFLHSRHKIP